MSRREIETAKAACNCILECERRGIPAKCYYRVDGEALKNALKAVQSRLAESAILDSANAPNSDGGIRQSTNTETTQEITSQTTIDDVHFMEFWKAYPKKTGKLAAMRAWKKIKQPATVLPQFLAALEKQKESDQWTRDHGQYIPNPATWLNQGRWDDEVAAPKGQIDYSEGF